MESGLITKGMLYGEKCPSQASQVSSGQVANDHIGKFTSNCIQKRGALLLLLS